MFGPTEQAQLNGQASGEQAVLQLRAFSLLLCTVKRREVRLFLKKSRTSRRLTVQSRSENALSCQHCYTSGWICELLMRSTTTAERSTLKAFRIGVNSRFSSCFFPPALDAMLHLY